jgi:hypothetical protein
MFKLLIRLFASLIFLSAGVISARPVTWTFSGVTLSDGGTMSGSFVYDADTNTYSSINITTSGGSQTGTTFAVAHTAVASSANFFYVLPSGPITALSTHSLLLVFPAALTNAGGTRALVLQGEFVCGGATCAPTPGISLRDSAGGLLTGVPVPPPPPTTPAPTSVLLLATGLLAAFTWQMSRGWRRTRAQ